MNEAVQANEERFRAIFEMAAVGMAVISPEGRLIAANGKLSEITGYSNDELLSRTFQQITFHDDLKVNLGLQQNLFDGTVANYAMEKRYIRKDGSTVWANVTVALVRHSDGRPKYFVSVIESIDQRKQADAELRASEELYRSLFENMLNGFAYCKMLYEEGLPPDFIYLSVNTAFETHTTLHNVVGKRVSEIIPGIHASDPHIFDIYGRVARGGNPATFETYFQSLGKWFHISAYCPKPDHFIAVFDDITKRKVREIAYQRINRVLRTLSHGNEALVRASNEADLYLRMCEVIVETGGYRMAWIGVPETDDARTVRPVAHGGFEDGYLTVCTISWADKPHGWGPVGTAIRTGLPQINDDTDDNAAMALWRETALKRGYRSCIALPLKTDSEVFACLAIYSADTGGFTADETALFQDLANDIAYGVSAMRDRQRRQEMERQLHQAQKMEALGTFAGGIAHDFNNILTGILGFAQLVIGDSGNPGLLAEDIDEIKRAASRAKDLVQQILTYSRNINIDKSPVDIVGLAREVHSLIRVGIPSSIDISINAAMPEAFVLAAPANIHQILLNLCLNSADAIGDASGTIVISITPAERMIRLEVADSGEGINDSVRERIFDPFFTTKGTGKGSGLGLSVVKGIVDDMGGTIAVESGGDGTRFIIVLPECRPDGAQQVVAETPDPPPPPLTKATSRRVLVVDDEIAIVTLLSRVFRREGWDIVTSASAREALEHVAAGGSFGLVITDQGMPEMSGLELAASIHALQPQIPIILMSGQEAPASDALERAGISSFIPKPIDGEALTTILKIGA
ncbi:MAG: PAS domain S-box protein [Alphaproteobacteria bacterium]|nr:PAS domain S-box protein [Alphaproteobacteria bacterium]